MKTCKKCKTQNLSDAKFCEKCGEKLGSGKGLTIILLIISVILVIGGVWYFVGRGNGSGSNNIVESDSSDGFTAPVDVLKRIKENGVIRVAVEDDAEPFNWIDEETNETKGFEFELITLVAKEIGVKVQLTWSSDYENIPNMISKEQNEADIFMGAYIANPIFDFVAWSDPYYETGYCLIVPDGSAIKSLKDLQNKKIGVYNEDSAEEFVKENVTSPAAIKRYDDSKHEGEDWLMIHLVDKKASEFNEELVDAAIYDYPFAKTVVSNSDGDLNIVEYNLNSFAYQIGLPKNNYELRTELNGALRKVMASDDYKELVIKYLNFDFDANSDITDKEVKIHVVERGETLGSIAVKYFNNSNRWKEIWQANKNRIPDFNLIVVGHKLIIPNV